MKKKVVKKRLYFSIPLLLTILIVVLMIYIVNTRTSKPQELYGYQVINTFPHDPNAFTQGLVYADGFLYESTGLEGRSSIRKVELETGKVVQIYNLPDKYFGEGITIFEDKIIQLTYQSHVGFVYNKTTFEPLQQFSYRTEGWGLTHNGKQIIMSDGSASISFLDPNSFELISRVPVYYKGSLLRYVNELEYINGKVFANIWGSDYIAVIDPHTGQVKSIIDLKGLLKTQDTNGKVDVLNGIAYDAVNKRLFVTGKLWPKLFEIKLISKKM
ncbi:MAG: glutaminyl-peptide cyclotransferase [Sedimentisphaerales bacterium]|nr:glutaminyl-peptide cyclotransferase [Sedimentisphaerales bacterium]